MKFCLGALVIMLAHLIKSNQITPDNSTTSENTHDNTTSNTSDFDLRNTELKKVAQGAAKQAYTAASSQEAAGNQATQIARVNVAEQAERAAIAVQVAYLAKYALINFLEEQRREALDNLDSGLSQFQLVQEAANAAAHKAQLATEYVAHLSDVLKMAENLAEFAAKEAENCAEILNNQQQIAGHARVRVDITKNQFTESQKEYEDIRHSASIAFKAARIAQFNAKKSESFFKKSTHNDNSQETTDESKEETKEANVTENNS